MGEKNLEMLRSPRVFLVIYTNVQRTDRNQALQQTGHANNGFPSVSAFSRVSRLLSGGVRRGKLFRITPYHEVSPKVSAMPLDDDLYDEYQDDGCNDIEEDDRDASYYEFWWGGPEDEELEDWYNEQERDDEDEYGYSEDDYGPEDFEPPLPAPLPGDEAGARKYFAALKRKYKAESFRDTSPLSGLYKILLKLESSEQLDNNDLSWLRKNRLRGPMRIFFAQAARKLEDRFNSKGYFWDVVRAASLWRQAEQPSKALAITADVIEKIPAFYPKPKSAVLTTRGGAFRDLGDLAKAEACGREATEIDKRSFYPHNLLGAIYYQKGDPQMGDEHFATAKRLGAKPEVQDRAIEMAVSRAGAEEQRIVAQYLLNKDSVKYHWAKKYLH